MSDFERRLADAKSASLLQPLMRASRLLNELGLARKRRGPGPHRTRAHMALYPHISLEGTRPSVIAERLGVTPQAVAPLVRDLEQMGLVERRPDPADGRARLVVFTEQGRRDLLDGFEILKGIEAEIEDHMGAEDYAVLLRLMARLDAIAIELSSPPE